MKPLYVYTLLLTVLLLVGCAKNEETVDNWETPNLTFKKADQDSSKKSVLTQSFKEALSPRDQFEFEFKGESSKKQKSITNVRVRARCAEDSEMSKGIFEEQYDLGTRPIFTAHDLLPPQSILENSKTVFCKWTIIAVNTHGSTRSYSLPVLRLDDDNSSTKISIKDADGKDLPPGSSINFQNSKGMTFSTPDSGSFTAALKCDLVTINLASNNTIVGDFVVEESNNEQLRHKHPMQRCLIEVKSNTGKIYRSGGFRFYLFPSVLSTSEVQFDTSHQQDFDMGDMFIGTVRITNHSDEERLFGFLSSTFSYDIFFFDDRHANVGANTYLNSEHYWYQRKNDGKPYYVLEGADVAEVAGMKFISVKPHQDIKGVGLRIRMSVSCGGGGEYSKGGIRVPYGADMFGERAPYKDRRGNLVDLPIPGTTVHFNSPYPFFIRFGHGKLFNHPSAYTREWRVTPDRGC